jgi:hypothetical protein
MNKQRPLLAALILLLAGCATNTLAMPPLVSEPDPGLFSQPVTLQARVVRFKKYGCEDYLLSLSVSPDGSFRSVWMTDMGLKLADFGLGAGKNLVTVNTNPAQFPAAYINKVLTPMIRTVFGSLTGSEMTRNWQTEGTYRVLTFMKKGQPVREIRYELDPLGHPTRIFYRDNAGGSYWEIYLLSFKVGS